MVDSRDLHKFSMSSILYSSVCEKRKIHSAKIFNYLLFTAGVDYHRFHLNGDQKTKKEPRKEEKDYPTASWPKILGKHPGNSFKK